MNTIILLVYLGKVHLIWQGGMKILNIRKFLDTWKGGSEKIRGSRENMCTLNPKGGGGGGVVKNWTASEGGC